METRPISSSKIENTGEIKATDKTRGEDPKSHLSDASGKQQEAELLPPSFESLLQGLDDEKKIKKACSAVQESLEKARLETGKRIDETEQEIGRIESEFSVSALDSSVKFHSQEMSKQQESLTKLEESQEVRARCLKLAEAFKNPNLRNWKKDRWNQEDPKVARMLAKAFGEARQQLADAQAQASSSQDVGATAASDRQLESEEAMRQNWTTLLESVGLAQAQHFQVDLTPAEQRKLCSDAGQILKQEFSKLKMEKPKSSSSEVKTADTQNPASSGLAGQTPTLSVESAMPYSQNPASSGLAGQTLLRLSHASPEFQRKGLEVLEKFKRGEHLDAQQKIAEALEKAQRQQASAQAQASSSQGFRDTTSETRSTQTGDVARAGKKRLYSQSLGTASSRGPWDIGSQPSSTRRKLGDELGNIRLGGSSIASSMEVDTEESNLPDREERRALKSEIENLLAGDSATSTHISSSDLGQLKRDKEALRGKILRIQKQNSILDENLGQCVYQLNEIKHKKDALQEHKLNPLGEPMSEEDHNKLLASYEADEHSVINRARDIINTLGCENSLGITDYLPVLNDLAQDLKKYKSRLEINLMVLEPQKGKAIDPQNKSKWDEISIDNMRLIRNHAKELIRNEISLEDTKIAAEKVCRIFHKRLGDPGDSPATFGDRSKPPETEQEQFDFLMEFLKYRQGNLKDLYLVIQKRIGEPSTSDSQNKSIWDKIGIGYLRAAKNRAENMKKREDMLEITKINAEKASRIFQEALRSCGQTILVGDSIFGDKSKPPETEQEQLDFLMEFLKGSRSSSLKDLYLVIQKQIDEPSTSDSQRGFGSNEIGTRASGQESKIPGNISGTGAESSNRAVEQPHDDAAHRGEAFPEVKRRKRKPKVEEASPSDTLVEDENKSKWDKIDKDQLKTIKYGTDAKISSIDLSDDVKIEAEMVSRIIREKLGLSGDDQPKFPGRSDPPQTDEEKLTILMNYLANGNALLKQMHLLIERVIK